MGKVPTTGPTWSELRSRKYCKIAQHNKHGIQHSRAWESTNHPANSLHSLRVSADFVEYLRKKRGPKGRRSSRVLGKTPDESYIQRGQRAKKLPHQLRAEMNRLFHSEPQYLVRMLNNHMYYKPQKRIRINMVMPHLAEAIKELSQEVRKIDPSLEHHSALAKGWLPCVARLIEIRWHEQRETKPI